MEKEPLSRKIGRIRKAKIIEVEKTPEGFTIYTCKDNKINAKLHPKFGSRKAARRHIMEVHYSWWHHG